MAILATDSFNRANETPLAAPWAKIVSTTSTFNLASSAVTPAVITSDDEWYYGGVVFPNDQYALVKVTTTASVAGNGGGVLVRGSNGAARTCYRGIVGKNASNNVEVGKFVAGTYTALGSRTTTWVDGDVLRLNVIGTILRIFQNGTQLGADITDSAVTSGWAGIAHSSNSLSLTLDDWEGGNFGGRRRFFIMDLIILFFSYYFSLLFFIGCLSHSPI